MCNTGCIALLRNDRKFPYLGGRCTLTVYNGAGCELFCKTWKWSTDPVIGMGWTLDEKLVCVIEDGRVLA